MGIGGSVGFASPVGAGAGGLGGVGMGGKVGLLSVGGFGASESLFGFKDESGGSGGKTGLGVPGLTDDGMAAIGLASLIGITGGLGAISNFGGVGSEILGIGVAPPIGSLGVSKSNDLDSGKVLVSLLGDLCIKSESVSMLIMAATGRPSCVTTNTSLGSSVDAI